MKLKIELPDNAVAMTPTHTIHLRERWQEGAPVFDFNIGIRYRDHKGKYHDYTAAEPKPDYVLFYKEISTTAT